MANLTRISNNATIGEDNLMGYAQDFVYQAGVNNLFTDLIISQDDTLGRTVKCTTGIGYIPVTTYARASRLKRFVILEKSTNETGIAVSVNSTLTTRIDLVVAQFNSGTTPNSNNDNTISIQVIQGVSNNVAPAVPSNSLLLATLTLPQNFSQVTNSMITDNRVSAGIDSLKIANYPYIDIGLQATRTGNNSVTFPKDVSGNLRPGDYIYVIDSTAKFFVILNLSVSSGVTSVNFIPSSDYSLVSNPTQFYYAHEQPVNFPSQFNYVPTLTGNSGMTISSVSITYCTFRTFGRNVTVDIGCTFTTGGTAGNEVFVSLPGVNSSNHLCYGSAVINSGTYNTVSTELSSSASTMGVFGSSTFGNWSLGASKSITATGTYII